MKRVTQGTTVSIIGLCTAAALIGCSQVEEREAQTTAEPNQEEVETAERSSTRAPSGTSPTGSTAKSGGAADSKERPKRDRATERAKFYEERALAKLGDGQGRVR